MAIIGMLLSYLHATQAFADEGQTCLNTEFYSELDSRATCWIRGKEALYSEKRGNLADEFYRITDQLGLKQQEDVWKNIGNPYSKGIYEQAEKGFIQAAFNVLESFRLRRFEFSGPDTPETRKIVIARKEAALRVVDRAFRDFDRLNSALLDRIGKRCPARRAN